MILGYIGLGTIGAFSAAIITLCHGGAVMTAIIAYIAAGIAATLILPIYLIAATRRKPSDITMKENDTGIVLTSK